MKKRFLSIFLIFTMIFTFIPYGSINGQEEDFNQNEYIVLLDELIEAETRYGLSGVQLAIYKDGALIKSDSYGYTNNYRNVYDNGEIVLGKHDILPVEERISVNEDTLFDLASNTKIYATVYAVQKLASEGKISLDTKIGDVLPDFLLYANDNGWKDDLDVKTVLSHMSGFIPSPKYHDENYDEVDQIKNGKNDLYAQDRETVYEMVMKTPIITEPNTEWQYSDVDLMLVGFMVEKLTGKRLDEYLKENIYGPLGLDKITFIPLENGFNTNEIASTELNGNTRDGRVEFNNIRKDILTGTVHDEKAYYSFEGVAGHAGLFSNARDLAYLAQAMIFDGELNGIKLFTPEVIEEFTQPVSLRTQTTGGFRRKSEDGGASIWFSKFAPPGTIGHTGWTGTLTLIDKENMLTMSLNTNARNSPIMGPGKNDFYTKRSNISSYGLVSELVYRGLGLGEDEIKSADELLINLLEEKINKHREESDPSLRNVIRSMLEVVESRKDNSKLLNDYYNSNDIQDLISELDTMSKEDLKDITIIEDDKKPPMDNDKDDDKDKDDDTNNLEDQDKDKDTNKDNNEVNNEDKKYNKNNEKEKNKNVNENKNKNKESQDKSPKTGDMELNYLYIILSISLLGLEFIKRKNKKLNNKNY